MHCLVTSSKSVPNHKVIMVTSLWPSQITSLTIVFSTFYSDADQRKHQSPASLAFVRGIHRSPVNSPHNWPVTRKMFPFDNVIMYIRLMFAHSIRSFWVITSYVYYPLFYNTMLVLATQGFVLCLKKGNACFPTRIIKVDQTRHIYHTCIFC